MKIITAVVNNPTFIEIQYYTLKKYFKGDYEFIVFNDAKDFPDFTNGNDVTIKQQIIDLCSKLNIQCINIPNEHHKTTHSGSVRTADSMNYILKYQQAHPDKYLLLDSDMFLVDYFDINKYSEHDCAIVLQTRNNNIHYFWNGIYYFDTTRMKDLDLLNWNLSPSCDTGGMTQVWFKKYMGDEMMPKAEDIRWTDKTYSINNIYFIKHLWSCTWDMSELPLTLHNNEKLIDFLKNDPRNVNNKFFCEIYEKSILHYRAGGNWRNEGMDFHNTLTKKLKEALLN